MPMDLIENYLVQMIVLLGEWYMLLRAATVAASEPDTYRFITEGQGVLLRHLAALTPPVSLHRLHRDLIRMVETCLVLKATTPGDETVFIESLSEFEEAIQIIHVELHRLQRDPDRSSQG